MFTTYNFGRVEAGRIGGVFRNVIAVVDAAEIFHGFSKAVGLTRGHSETKDIFRFCPSSHKNDNLIDCGTQGVGIEAQIHIRMYIKNLYTMW